MSSITIQKISITDLATDAIVNAANDGLCAGSGVCGAIFRAAGHHRLQAACEAIGYCDTGSAVITPGFDLKAKFIIHAVGPRYLDGRHGEPEQLYGAYYTSLELAREHGCRSIGFPLISAGIFGYPMKDAWRKAIQACRDFQDRYPDAPDVVFAVLNEKTSEVGRKELEECAASSDGTANGHARKTLYQLTISGRTADAFYFHKIMEPHGFLSNWYPSPFELDGQRFSSVEQYIMYRKCVLFGDEASAAAVMATDDPEAQKAVGRRATGYNANAWEGARPMVLLRGLLAKFGQNEDLKRLLLETDDAYLVECAGSDKIWACGVRLGDEKRFDAENWAGSNILGFTLMEVREMLAEL